MIFGDGIVGAALLALWVYCMFDVITTDEASVRNLPKLLWLLLVMMLPDVGAIMWLIVGRPHNTSYQPGGSSYGPAQRRTRRPIGPEDRNDFASRTDVDALSPLAKGREEAARMRTWEAQLKRREEELRKREEGL